MMDLLHLHRLGLQFFEMSVQYHAVPLGTKLKLTGRCAVAATVIGVNKPGFSTEIAVCLTIPYKALIQLFFESDACLKITHHPWQWHSQTPDMHQNASIVSISMAGFQIIVCS